VIYSLHFWGLFYISRVPVCLSLFSPIAVAAPDETLSLSLSLARRDQPPIRRDSPTSTPFAVLPGKKIPRTPDAASCASCRENRSSFISTLIVLSVSATSVDTSGRKTSVQQRCPSLVIDSVRGEMPFLFPLKDFQAKSIKCAREIRGNARGCVTCARTGTAK